MKVIIQIPCFNEEESLANTLRNLPRSFLGISHVEWLLVDDGSTDRSYEIAKEYGVDKILKLPSHQGLGTAFRIGLKESIQSNADIVVHTDADNQYCADDIEKLIEPLLKDEADLVIGQRPLTHLKPIWKLFQWLGRRVVSFVSTTKVTDPTSGFRAMNLNALKAIQSTEVYSYTLETLIQIGLANLRTREVQVRVNQVFRPSRLIKSLSQYLWNSSMIILRSAAIYNPGAFHTMALLISTVLSILSLTVYLFFGGQYPQLFFIAATSGIFILIEVGRLKFKNRELLRKMIGSDDNIKLELNPHLT